MNAAVFYDGYLPQHETKDPGLIALGLNRNSCRTSLVTEWKPELANQQATFPVICASREKLCSADFWRDVEADCVICYSWFDPYYDLIVEAIIAGGKKAIVKADTDGRLGYPVMPRYVRDSAADRMGNSLRWLRHTRVFGRLSSRFDTRYRASMPERLRQIQLSNAVLIESPKAVVNLSTFLDYWGGCELRTKLHFMPNPVAEDVVVASPKAKRDLVISVGRWMDPRKNVHAMLECSNRFLSSHPDWKLRVLGEGEEIVEETVSKWAGSLQRRVEIEGQVPHGEVVELMADSRIFFAPSSSESWGMAAAEAACMGCTIVGTPLESFEYLTADGFSGTLSVGFAAKQILRALQFDVAKHAKGAYNPVEIARHWRSKLSLDQVSARIYKMITKL